MIDPAVRLVEIYRLGRDVEILRDGDVLTLPDLLSGWEVPVLELWAPEFD